MGMAMEGSLAAAIEQASARLRDAGVDNPGGDARALLANALGVVPTWIFAHALDPLAEDAADEIEHVALKSIL